MLGGAAYEQERRCPPNVPPRIWAGRDPRVCEQVPTWTAKPHAQPAMGAGGEAHAPPPGPGPIVSDGVVLAASSASAACVASPLRHRNGYRSAAAAVAVRRGVTPWRDPRGAGALQRVCAFNPLKSLTCMRCVSLHGSDAGRGPLLGPAALAGAGGAGRRRRRRRGAGRWAGQPYSAPRPPRLPLRRPSI
eukprot:tig00021339_g20420.t1